ncbi:MAG TPA: hypothetical protein VFE51_10785 [Verrucomicrobiae bacterium]|nr:hypothetical protein [Verrucomicrobiae bacterium]
MLPPEVLAAIVPLTPSGAARLNRVPPVEGMRAVSCCTDGSKDVQGWLRQIQPDGQVSVYVSWSDNLAVQTKWGIFTEYWNDFCYPSSDDVTIVPVAGGWRLEYSHDERFEFTTAA